jgi:hypothetical protein
MEISIKTQSRAENVQLTNEENNDIKQYEFILQDWGGKPNSLAPH